jgi:Ring finger domain
MSMGCVVCHQPFVENADADGAPRIIKACSHMFHHKCLEDWLKKSRSCPLCRSKRIEASQVFPHFVENDRNDDVTAIDDTKEKEIEELKTQLASNQQEIQGLNNRIQQASNMLKGAPNVINVPAEVPANDLVVLIETEDEDEPPRQRRRVAPGRSRPRRYYCPGPPRTKRYRSRSNSSCVIQVNSHVHATFRIVLKNPNGQLSKTTKNDSCKFFDR